MYCYYMHEIPAIRNIGTVFNSLATPTLCMFNDVSIPTVDLTLPFCTFFTHCKMREVCNSWKHCID